jgi:hypothetical protein
MWNFMLTTSRTSSYLSTHNIKFLQIFCYEIKALILNISFNHWCIHYNKMWVQFISPRSLDQWIHSKSTKITQRTWTPFVIMIWPHHIVHVSIHNFHIPSNGIHWLVQIFKYMIKFMTSSPKVITDESFMTIVI